MSKTNKILLLVLITILISAVTFASIRNNKKNAALSTLSSDSQLILTSLGIIKPPVQYSTSCGQYNSTGFNLDFRPSFMTQSCMASATIVFSSPPSSEISILERTMKNSGFTFYEGSNLRVQTNGMSEGFDGQKSAAFTLNGMTSSGSVKDGMNGSAVISLSLRY